MFVLYVNWHLIFHMHVILCMCVYKTMKAMIRCFTVSRKLNIFLSLWTCVAQYLHFIWTNIIETFAMRCVACNCVRSYFLSDTALGTNLTEIWAQVPFINFLCHSPITKIGSVYSVRSKWNTFCILQYQNATYLMGHNSQFLTRNTSNILLVPI